MELITAVLLVVLVEYFKQIVKDLAATRSKKIETIIIVAANTILTIIEVLIIVGIAKATGGI